MPLANLRAQNPNLGQQQTVIENRLQGGSKEAEWCLSDGQLRLRSRSGEELCPTVQGVYDAEFADARNVAGFTVRLRPSEALPTIRFSRRPLNVVAALREEATGDLPVVRVVCIGSYESREWDVTHQAQQGVEHCICDDTWYPFRSGVLEEIVAALRTEQASFGDRLTLGQYLGLRRLATTQPALEDQANLSKALGETAPRAEWHMPDGFEGEPYPYQAVGYAWLSYVLTQGLGCILGDEMGLGKTFQAIALFTEAVSEGRGTCLVVCPSTLLENWRRELAKFAPGLSVLMHRGSNRTGFPSDLRAADVVVVSYDTLANDLSMFKLVRWAAVALDEAQNIKTPSAKRTRSAKALPREFSLAVTGTPLENGLRDLWSICDFVLPGYLGTQTDFERDYDDSQDSASALEPLVSPILLRRRVKDVARDLPPLIDIPEALELDSDAAIAYDELRGAARSRFDGSFDLAHIQKLRMFCAHPSLVTGLTTEDPSKISIKYSRLLEVIEEIDAAHEKTLVFVAFTGMVDLLLHDLPKRGYDTDWIDGRVPMGQRQPKIDAFADPSGPSVLVLNPRAAGTGLNITAANHVVHYTLEWNPAVIDQASARAYRRGQERPVTVRRLFYAGTVEEVMDDRLRAKRDLASLAVKGTTGRSQSLNDLVRALEISPADREDWA